MEGRNLFRAWKPGLGVMMERDETLKKCLVGQPVRCFSMLGASARLQGRPSIWLMLSHMIGGYYSGTLSHLPRATPLVFSWERGAREGVRNGKENGKVGRGRSLLDIDAHGFGKHDLTGAAARATAATARAGGGC